MDPVTAFSTMPVEPLVMYSPTQLFVTNKFAVDALALGLDELGGRAVNLMPAELPQDVYSRVLEGVIEQVRQSAAALIGSLSSVCALSLGAGGRHNLPR